MIYKEFANFQEQNLVYTWRKECVKMFKHILLLYYKPHNMFYFSHYWLESKNNSDWKTHIKEKRTLNEIKHSKLILRTIKNKHEVESSIVFVYKPWILQIELQKNNNKLSLKTMQNDWNKHKERHLPGQTMNQSPRNCLHSQAYCTILSNIIMII